MGSQMKIKTHIKFQSQRIQGREQEPSEFPAVWAGPQQPCSFCIYELSLYYMPTVSCLVQNLTINKRA